MLGTPVNILVNIFFDCEKHKVDLVIHEIISCH